MSLRPAIALILFLSSVPLAGQDATSEPEPFLRLDLRPYGYRFDLWDRSQVGFVSKDEVVVVINQFRLSNQAIKGPPRVMQEEDDEGTPPQTLVFSLLTQKVNAQGELGNDRFGALVPTRDGRFVMTATGQSLRLYDSKLEQLTSFKSPAFFSPAIEASPSARWIVLHRFQNNAWPWLILDANTLQPAGPAPVEGVVAFSDQGILVQRKINPKHQFADAVYYRTLDGQEQLLLHDPKALDVTGGFLSNDYVFAQDKVVSTAGKVLYAVEQSAGTVRSSIIHRCFSGARFALNVQYDTTLDELWDILKLNLKGPPHRQWIRVFDTATGRLVFAIRDDPRKREMKAALSPDGKQLAVLRDGFLEIFSLPPLP